MAIVTSAVVCASAAAPQSAFAADFFTDGHELMAGYGVNLGYFYETGPSDLRPYGHDVIKGSRSPPASRITSVRA